MEIGETIKSKRESLGMSQQKLAKLAKTTQQTIDRVERGITRWSRHMPQILRALDIPDPTQGAVSAAGIRETATEIPILSVTEAEPGIMETTDIYGGSFPRPGSLHNAIGVYAIYMHGQQMSPVYRAGDLLVVNPHQPPRTNDGALFLSQKRDRLIVAEYDRETPREWIVRQYGTKPHSVALPKKLYPICETIHAVFRRG